MFFKLYPREQLSPLPREQKGESPAITPESLVPQMRGNLWNWSHYAIKYFKLL